VGFCGDFCASFCVEFCHTSNGENAKMNLENVNDKTRYSVWSSALNSVRDSVGIL